MTRFILITLMVLLLAASAAPAETSVRAARAFGNGVDVLRLSAATLLRWQDGDVTLLDLRGNVEVCQGLDRITSPRLLVWFRETGPAGARSAAVEVYGEKGAVVVEGGKRTPVENALFVRATTRAGLVLAPLRTLAGDPPMYDPFHARAFALRGETPLAPTEALKLGLFGDVRVSAESSAAVTLPNGDIVVTLTGNAEVSSERTVLSADAIRVTVHFRDLDRRNPQVQHIYAEGAVDVRRENERITASAVYLDVPNEQGLAIDARIRSMIPRAKLPVQFHADAIREESLYRFRAEGRSYLTASKMAEPHYRVEGSDIEMVRGPAPEHVRRNLSDLDKAGTFGENPGEPPRPQESLIVSARHNAFYIESVPVLYWPYVAKDVRTGAFLVRSLEIGHSSSLGTFVRLGWDPYDLGVYFNDWSSLTLRTDYYGARGPAAGFDFSYAMQQRLGFIRTYYVHDAGEKDDNNYRFPHEDRGEFTWRHREELGEKWRLDGEIGYLTDRGYLRTYDRRGFDEDKDRETQLFLSRLSYNTEIIAQVRHRINDFQNQVDRDSVQYHIIGERVLSTPLLWTSHTDLARLQLRPDRKLDVANPDPVERLDTGHELSWPFSLGPVRADPYVWGNATAFSEQADDGASVGRFASAYGLRTATNFYRSYPDASSAFFGIDRLRHVITPSVDYQNIFWVSRDPSDLIQHDEIDALDTAHRALFQVRNRLQTYRDVEGRRERVDFLVLDLGYALHIRNPEALKDLDDYLQASLTWLLSENIELASIDNRFNTDKGRLESLNGELTLKYWRPIMLSFIQKYYVDITQTGDPTHDVSLVRLAFQPAYSRWRVEWTTAYDWGARRRAGDKSDPASLGTGLFIARELDGWELRLGAEFSQGIHNDTVFTFNITPPGVKREFRSDRTPVY